MIIGFSGRAGSGKDTAVLAVERAFNRFISTKKGSFAFPVKKIIATMFSVNSTKFEDRDWKESADNHLGISPRKLAQLFGTNFARDNVSPDIWIKWLQEEHKEQLSNPEALLLISDVRFDNEAEWITSQGGIVIKIDRQGVDNSEGHSSEDGIANHLIYRIITNNDTLSRFKYKVITAASEYLAYGTK